ncbi:Polysaccharide biosynthesis protein [Vibrio aerogenes CECT 7868]|uniref:Polysaccharide biosynthesis protein n=1 Tax=Vibrio aerogenes CECT 7868 TaxID=1216006 RepID=A0A1M5ZAR7_9VIBR|nr:lipopolysaccharide biosynthesis protein [Vibrio aerogenes]SHI21310.1 Polysaccharide biosynthesis protein [Vibrio aerogenes CECT 7868]
MTRKTVHSMLIYGTSLLMMKGLSLLMLPVMTHYMDAGQLGKLELIASIGAFLGILSTAAMHENLYRFVGHLTDQLKRFHQAAGLMTFSMLIGTGIGVLLLTILLTLPEAWWQSIPLTKTESALLILALAFEGPVSLHLAWLRMNDRATTFFSVSVLTTVLQIMMITGVLLWHPSVTGILLAGTVTRYVQLVILHRVNGFPVRPPTQAKQLLAYSTPLMLSALIAFGLSGAERWMIAYASDLTTLGYYAIAAKFALAMCILVQPFGMWWMPKRFQVLSEQGGQAAVRQTQAGIVYILALAVLICFVGQIFIRLALPQSYYPAQQLLIMTMVIALFKEITELLNLGMLYQKKTGVLFRLNLIMTAGTLLTTLMLMHRGIEWILWTLAAAQGIRCLCVLIIGQRHQPLPYQHTSLVCLLCMSGIFLSAAWFVQATHLRLLLAITAPVCLILFALSLNYIRIPYQAGRLAEIRSMLMQSLPRFQKRL